MGGVAGHAGLFGCARGVGDLARLVLRGLRGEDTGLAPSWADPGVRASLAGAGLVAGAGLGHGAADLVERPIPVARAPSATRGSRARHSGSIPSAIGTSCSSPTASRDARPLPTWLPFVATCTTCSAPPGSERRMRDAGASRPIIAFLCTAFVARRAEHRFDRSGAPRVRGGRRHRRVLDRRPVQRAVCRLPAVADHRDACLLERTGTRIVILWALAVFAHGNRRPGAVPATSSRCSARAPCSAWATGSARSASTSSRRACWRTDRRSSST